MNEAAEQNWGTRALERQIGTLYYERLLLSKDRKPVRAEAARKTATADRSPRAFVRDPVMLEFLGFPEAGKLQESKLEDALLANLQAFLLELGKGFAFVARQQRISTESKDFYLDLVFYVQNQSLSRRDAEPPGRLSGSRPVRRTRGRVRRHAARGAETVEQTIRSAGTFAGYALHLPAEHLIQYEQEKKNVGELWESKSGGKALFLWAIKKDAAGREVHRQLEDKIRGRP